MPWHGNAFHITGHLWGESTDDQWILPTKGPVMSSFDVFFFIVSFNKLLNKQFSHLLFEIPWLLHDAIVMTYYFLYDSLWNIETTFFFFDSWLDLAKLINFTYFCCVFEDLQLYFLFVWIHNIFWNSVSFSLVASHLERAGRYVSPQVSCVHMSFVIDWDMDK